MKANQPIVPSTKDAQGGEWGDTEADTSYGPARWSSHSFPPCGEGEVNKPTMMGRRFGFKIEVPKEKPIVPERGRDWPLTCPLIYFFITPCTYYALKRATNSSEIRCFASHAYGTVHPFDRFHPIRSQLDGA